MTDSAEAVERLLQAEDFPAALTEFETPALRPTLRLLLARLSDPSPRARGRAAAAVGLLGARLAEGDREAGRDLLRRLAWNLSEESGNCPFGIAEAMAEIMVRDPGLAEEFTPILITLISPAGPYLEAGPLQRGAVWSVARLAEVRPELVADAVPDLLALLASGDPGARGAAAIALARMGVESARGAVEALGGDEREFEFYEDGEVRRMRVSAVARVRAPAPRSAPRY